MQMSIDHIPVDLLAPHPENSNFMNEERLKKLRRHIERSGRYEPLTVRPHPLEEGKFQVINGHNRLRVLRALQHPTAQCVVWNLDDHQTRVYLATLNRLSGTDVPERRATLLESLVADCDVKALAELLPEDNKQLEQLRRLTHIETDEITGRTPSKEGSLIPVVLTFMLDEPAARQVNLALDLVINADAKETGRSQALARLAHFYLRHCGPTLEQNEGGGPNSDIPDR